MGISGNLNKFLVSQCLKNFVGEPSGVCENFWFRNISFIRGGITNFGHTFFALKCRKIK